MHKAGRSRNFVSDAAKYLDLVKKHFDVVIVVFDGKEFPPKDKEHQKRTEKRENELKRGNELLAQGKREEATVHFARAKKLEEKDILSCMDECTKRKIPYIRAPYEADSQLAWLEREKIIDAIITEDSDILVYGSKISIFKLKMTGKCEVVYYEDIYRGLVESMGRKYANVNKTMNKNFKDNFLRPQF